MPTTDLAKNLMYVKKSQALKKQIIGIDAFKEIHAGEQQKYRDNLRKEKGEEAYKKQQAEYMKAYRASKKAQQQPKQQQQQQPKQQPKPEFNKFANTLQNAFRNKLARNEVLKLKQDKANSLISQINQEKTTRDLNQLKTKLNASVMVNDILNNVFPSVINTNFPIKPVGRPRLTPEQKALKEQQKLQKPKKPVGRPKKYI